VYTGIIEKGSEFIKKWGNVMEVLGVISLVLLLVIWLSDVLSVKRRLDNYPENRSDNRKLYNDVANGVSVAERRRRCVNGYYDYHKR